MKRLFLITMLVTFVSTIFGQVAYVEGPSTIVANGETSYRYELSTFEGYSQMWASSSNVSFSESGGITSLTITPDAMDGGTISVYGYTNGSPALSKTVSCHPQYCFPSGPLTQQVYGQARYTVYPGLDDYEWTVSGACGAIYGGGDGYNYILCTC